MKRPRAEFDKNNVAPTGRPRVQRAKGNSEEVNNRVQLVHVPSSATNTPTSQVPATQRRFMPSWIPRAQPTQIVPQSQIFSTQTPIQSQQHRNNTSRTYICQIPEDYNLADDQIVEPSPSPERPNPEQQYRHDANKRSNTEPAVVKMDSLVSTHSSTQQHQGKPPNQHTTAHISSSGSSSYIEATAYNPPRDNLSSYINAEPFSTAATHNPPRSKHHLARPNLEPVVEEHVTYDDVAESNLHDHGLDYDESVFHNEVNPSPYYSAMIDQSGHITNSAMPHPQPMLDDALLDKYVENFEMEALEDNAKATSSALNSNVLLPTIDNQFVASATMATTTITTTIDSTNQQQTKPSESLPAIKQEGPKQLSIAKDMKAAVSKRDSTVVSLGSWYFDKRAKKRKYLSLTGKVYVGAEAMRRCQLDQYNDQHPAIRLRTDLKFGCELAAVDTKLLQLYQEFSVSMSSLQEKHVLTMLSTWGLPEKLVNKYKSHKIKQLFPWQIDCLMMNQGEVLDGKKNLVYSAPTSGGKTLVAEILMLRRLAQTMFIGDPKKRFQQQQQQQQVSTSSSNSNNTGGVERKTIFFVVPFIALAEEKVTYFQDIWSDMNIGIRAYHQDNGLDNTLGKEVEVVICTIERANILLNQLLDEHREAQLSMIVIDEVHLLSDPQRGFLLEVMLSKVKYLQAMKTFPHHVQVIGMSATLPNIKELAAWLDATLYMTNYRPVNLDILACMNRKLYRCNVKESAIVTAALSEKRANEKKEAKKKKSKKTLMETAKHAVLVDNNRSLRSGGPEVCRDNRTTAESGKVNNQLVSSIGLNASSRFEAYEDRPAEEFAGHIEDEQEDNMSILDVPSRRHLAAIPTNAYDDGRRHQRVDVQSESDEKKLIPPTQSGNSLFVPTIASLPRRPSSSSLVNNSSHHNHDHGLHTSLVTTNKDSLYSGQVALSSSSSSMSSYGNDRWTGSSADAPGRAPQQRQPFATSNASSELIQDGNLTIPLPIPPCKPKSIEVLPTVMDGPSNQRPQLSSRSLSREPSQQYSKSSKNNSASSTTIHTNASHAPPTVGMGMSMSALQKYDAMQMFIESAEALQVPGANIHIPVPANSSSAQPQQITVNVYNCFYVLPNEFTAGGSVGVNAVTSLHHDANSIGSRSAFDENNHSHNHSHIVSNTWQQNPGSLWNDDSSNQNHLKGTYTNHTSLNISTSDSNTVKEQSVGKSLFDQVRESSAQQGTSSGYRGGVAMNDNNKSKSESKELSTTGMLPSLPTIPEELYDEDMYSRSHSHSHSVSHHALQSIVQDTRDPNEKMLPLNWKQENKAEVEEIFPTDAYPENIDEEDDDEEDDEDSDPDPEIDTTTLPMKTKKTVEYEPSRDLPFGSSDPTTTHLLLPPPQQQTSPQIDGFKALCIETIEEGKSALIFLNSKRRCESTAKVIHDVLRWHRQNRQQFQPQQQKQQHQSMAGGIEGEGSLIMPFMSASMILKPILKGQNTLSSSVAVNNKNNILTNKQHGGGDLFAMNAIQQKRMHLIDELSQTPVGLCPILRETILVGVAYHHAGLTHDERKLIEDGFRKGILQVLCTTSTLSAGVNLPANRVIIRSLQMADQFISVATFRQMCGRAGRTGFDMQGEAIIMLDNGSDKVDSRLREHCDRLLSTDLEPLKSSLHLGNGGGLEKLLLEMITCGRLLQEQEVLHFVSCTLFSIQFSPTEVYDFVKEAIVFLKQHNFIQLSHQGVLLPSALGKATMLSGIAPKDVIEILPSLLLARSKLLLHHGNAGLHPIFLVTPPCTLAPNPHPNPTTGSGSGTGTGTGNASSLSHYSGSTGGIEPDWDNFEKLVDLLLKDYPEMNQLLSLLQIEHAHLLACKFHKPSIQSDRYKLYKRLYNAILLFTLIQEWPLHKILSFTSLASTSGSSGNNTVGNRSSSNTTMSSSSSASSSSSRGQLQQLLKDASTFCGMVIVFCKKLNWPMLVSCLEELQSRLSYGVASKDVLPLVRIGSDVMSVARARAFVKQDIKSPYDLVSVGAETLAHILVDSLPFHERNALEMLHGNLQQNKSSDGTAVDIGDDQAVTRKAEMNRIKNEKIFDAYLRLAKKIIQRANDYIKDELRRKQQQFYT